MAGRLVNRIERLEREGGADTVTLALGHAAISKMEAGVAVRDLTDAELEAIIVMRGGIVPDVAAMSDEDLGALCATGATGAMGQEEAEPWEDSTRA